MHACTLFMVERDGKKDEGTIAFHALSFYDVFYTFEVEEGFCCYGCHSMQYWFVHLKTIIIVIEIWDAEELWEVFMTTQKVQAPFRAETFKRENSQWTSCKLSKFSSISESLITHEMILTDIQEKVTCETQQKSHRRPRNKYIN